MYTLTSIVAVLAISIGLIDAVALSDFRPATTGLTSTCNRAYQAQIPGCQASDFSGGTGCSSACIQGLLQTNTDISSSCPNANVAGDSIVGIFLAGKGLRALCNIEVVTKTLGDRPTAAPAPIPSTTAKLTSLASPTQPSTPSPGTSNKSSLAVPPASSSVSRPSSATSNKSSLALSSASSSAQSIMTIPLTSSSTSLSSIPAQTATVASQASGPSILPQCTNPGNGQGGSPFDQVPGKECTNAALSLSVSSLFSFICVCGALLLPLL